MGLLEKVDEMLEKRKKALGEINELVKRARDNSVLIRIFSSTKGTLLVIGPEGIQIPRLFFGFRGFSIEKVAQLPYPTHPFWKQYNTATTVQSDIEIISV